MIRITVQNSIGPENIPVNEPDLVFSNNPSGPNIPLIVTKEKIMHREMKAINRKESDASLIDFVFGVPIKNFPFKKTETKNKINRTETKLIHSKDLGTTKSNKIATNPLIIRKMELTK